MSGSAISTLPTGQVDRADVQAELDRLRELGDHLRRQLQRYDQELRMAARLQQDFLPRRMPDINGLKFATYYQPAEIVSGDVYDVFRLDEEHLGLYVADAIGHGVAAALLSMFVKRAMVTKRIFNKSYRIVPPAETINLLNEELTRQELPHCQFASLCYAVVNARTGAVRLSRGGHPAPAMLRADGSVEFPQPEGALLGVMTGQSYGTAHLQMAPGDRLVIFTDGVEEVFAQNGAGQSWQAELRRMAHLPLDRFFAELGERIDRMSLVAGPSPDDVTVVGMERGPSV